MDHKRKMDQRGHDVMEGGKGPSFKKVELQKWSLGWDPCLGSCLILDKAPLPANASIRDF